MAGSGGDRCPPHFVAEGGKSGLQRASVRGNAPPPRGEDKSHRDHNSSRNGIEGEKRQSLRGASSNRPRNGWPVRMLAGRVER